MSNTAANSSSAVTNGGGTGTRTRFLGIVPTCCDSSSTYFLENPPSLEIARNRAGGTSTYFMAVVDHSAPTAGHEPHCSIETRSWGLLTKVEEATTQGQLVQDWLTIKAAYDSLEKDGARD